MASITSIFGELGISIEAILQKEPGVPVDNDSGDEIDSTNTPVVPIILLTRRVREGLMEQAIERVQALDPITQKVVRLRVESLS